MCVCVCLFLFYHHEKILEKNNLHILTPGHRGFSRWWNGWIILDLWWADYHGNGGMMRRWGSPLSSQEMGEVESGLALECSLLLLCHPRSHLLLSTFRVGLSLSGAAPPSSHLWNDPTETPRSVLCQSPRPGLLKIFYPWSLFLCVRNFKWP